MDKVIPQAKPLEEAVIGAIMISKEAMPSVCDLLTPESFYDDRHKLIYQTCQSLFRADQPIDLLTVSESLKAFGQLDKIGGAFYLVELTNRVASAANIEAHARILQQKQIRRSLIEAGHKLVKQGFSEEEDIFELLEQAEKMVFDIQADKSGGVKHISGFAAQSVERVEKLSKSTKEISGIPSGFHELDNVTAGWQPSDLIIVAARPGMGKTAMTLAMARNASAQGVPVAIFSLEMSSRQLTDRLISMESGCVSGEIRTGKIENWNAFLAGAASVSDAPIYVDDTPGINVYEIRSRARRAVMKHGIQLIIIDYLQLMSGEGKSREQEVSKISRSLKGLAKELDVPVIALSQLSRAVEIRGGSKRPQLSDLRESGAIEQDADIVSFIYRPEYYNIVEDEEGQSLKGIAEVIIAKHRNGALKTVKLKFIDRLALFKNIEDFFPMNSYSNRQEPPPF